MQTKSNLQTILEACDDCQVCSYSGRGMSGRTCLGIVVNSSVGEVLAMLVESVDDSNREEIVQAVRSMRTDSMGRGVVLYWPSIAFVGPTGAE
jgi:hypothetical protein